MKSYKLTKKSHSPVPATSDEQPERAFVYVPAPVWPRHPGLFLPMMYRVVACRLFVPEVKNRATITGAIEIGRAPGVVQVTFLAPAKALARRGLDELVRTHYRMETG